MNSPNFIEFLMTKESTQGLGWASASKSQLSGFLRHLSKSWAGWYLKGHFFWLGMNRVSLSTSQRANHCHQAKFPMGCSFLCRSLRPAKPAVMRYGRLLPSTGLVLCQEVCLWRVMWASKLNSFLSYLTLPWDAGDLWDYREKHVLHHLSQPVLPNSW